MKMTIKDKILFIFFGAVVACLAVSISASAKDSSNLSQSQADMIVQNCTQIQATLSSIHSSDALLRVNRGQTYELIASRLMSPMNTRIAANNLDGASLIQLTSDYSDDLSDFRDTYISYERQMAKTIRTNCHKSADSFYQNLVKTRQLRQEVHEYVVDINKGIRDYEKAFDSFRKMLTLKGSTE
ncbi:MAG: hypothetical protein L0H36_02340 [bacterium]|nr:hypothetical protein [bacterium]